jgi:acetoin utilization deacetylase AcuC-like enzyme
MTTALYTHQACLEHDPGLGHPECPARLRSVLAALEAPSFEALDRREAPRATIEQLVRVHPEEFVRALLAAVPQQGRAGIDADTILSPGSGEAALRAAGAVCAAVDAVATGEVANAFCAVRPPGHHAEPAQAMGFCLFNNVAVGALHARAAHGLRRIAMVDFDVHHGNGNETVARGDADLFYASTHQWPLYPGTGAALDHGRHNNLVNACLRPGAGSEQFRAAIESQVLPALDAFRPDLILVSAGFDAHADDPLAQLDLEEYDYAWVTQQLLKLARLRCDGRLVSSLEGGYDLDALAASAQAHVSALMAA